MYKNLGVFGAGTMGTNIAHEFAYHGVNVSLYSRGQKTLDQSRAVMEMSLDVMAEGGLIKPEEIGPTLSRIHFTRDIEECALGKDAVLETIVEDKDAKKALYEKLDELCPIDTIFASDTSAMNIYELMPERRLPRTLITHYIAPAHLIPLVELVKGERTDPAMVADIKAMYQKMGKIPIVMEKLLPGFLLNRIQAAIGNEMVFLLENGYITAPDLDLAMKASLMPRGIVLGLVQRLDFAGLAMAANSFKRNIQTPPTEFTWLNDLVSQGHAGAKSGKGFYDYGGRDPREILAERDRRLIKVLKASEDIIRNPV